MNKGRCFIVGAGSFQGMPIVPEDQDFIIAADGGYTYLIQMGMEPDVLIGDFDSLDLIPEHRNLIRHSPIKDDTDMALAAAYAAKEGYQTFIIYGGLGGRLDHTMANLMLLNSMAQAGLEAYLIGEGIIVSALRNERIVFSKECEGTFSAFCLGEACLGVTEYGLKYGLDHAEVKSGMTLGVSNEFLGQECYVEVKKNVLTVIWDEKNGLPIRREKQEEEIENNISDMNKIAASIVSEMGWRSTQDNEAGCMESEHYNDNNGR